MKKLPTGSSCIDSLLGGGVETGTLTQVYGVSGSGKTSLCLMLAYNTAKRFGKVVYIDTEGLSPERVNQIFKDKEALKDVYIYDVYDFKMQSVAVREVAKLCEKESVVLVIVDSLTSLYRSELEDEEKQLKAKRELISQLTILLGLARKLDLAVVFTNQMFTDVRDGVDKPLGGPSVDHLSKVILSLEKSNGRRIARLIKHRSREEGAFCTFKITDRGIEP